MEEEGDDEALVCAMEAEGGLSEAAGPPPLEFPEHWSPLQDEDYIPSIAPGESYCSSPTSLLSSCRPSSRPDLPLTLSRSPLWYPL